MVKYLVGFDVKNDCYNVIKTDKCSKVKSWNVYTYKGNIYTTALDTLEQVKHNLRHTSKVINYITDIK